MQGIGEYIKRTAIGFFQGIAALLRSRKYLTLLSGLVALIIVALIPRLAPFFDMIFLFIMTAALANIGGIAYEDAAKTAKETPPPSAATPVKEMVETIVDELIRDTTNPLGTEHRETVTATIESQLVTKPAPLPADSAP